MNLPELVDPVLVCFDDQDARVRYYACESLYNISKVARSAVLVFFNKIFDGLCRVSVCVCKCVCVCVGGKDFVAVVCLFQWIDFIIDLLAVM